MGRPVPSPMPIYMDRHFVEGATAQALANAHTTDLQVQSRYGVRFLTYWFDEARSTAFCLVDSPDPAAIRHAHQEAHGQVPHEIIAVDPSVVEAFLGRVSDPIPQTADAPESGIDEAFRAVLFTDLKDSTLMTSTYGDARALHLLHVSNVLTRKALDEHQGREVKHTGDGIMASFVSVHDAVGCTVAIQQAFAEHRHRAPEDDLHTRIGLHAGEPIEEHGDLFGTVVQLAARLCAAAGPGEILVSETIQTTCHDPDVTFEDRGRVNLKGFLASTRVFAVDWT